MNKDLLSLFDLTRQDLEKILARAATLKKQRRQGRVNSPLKGKTLAMLFEKASTRTRVSFEIAMHELGGQAIYLESSHTQVGRGETYGDTAKVLSRYCHGLVVRTFGHAIIKELARFSNIPVINGLTDLYHPCQLLADLLTVREEKKRWGKVCYIGDGNNMAHSWIEASALLGFPLMVATPNRFGPSPVVLDRLDAKQRAWVTITEDPIQAVTGADVVNTDTWFSMGQEVSEVKKKGFAPYQVNAALLKRAAAGAIVLHCLPAHRGEEITEEVLDGPQSRVWQQAENRLHVQKAVLEMMLR